MKPPASSAPLATLTAFTGAGISVESGIPLFRGAGAAGGAGEASGGEETAKT